MTIHCFDVIYSPNASMDSYLDSWLTSWTAWTEEKIDNPHSLQYSNIETGNTVNASGFTQNRFEWEDTNRSPQADAEYIVSNLIGEVGYLASYCDWWIVRWHHCTHDGDGRMVEKTFEQPDGTTVISMVEAKGCGNRVVLDSSNNYNGQTDVPDEVPQ